MKLIGIGQAMAAVAISVAGIQSAYPQGVSIDHVALAVEAYEGSSEICYYDPVVSEAVTKLDKMYAASYGGTWYDARTRVANEIEYGLGLGDRMGAASPCVSWGMLIWSGLTPALLLIKNPKLEMEIVRLSEAGGRGIDEPPTRQQSSDGSRTPSSASDDQYTNYRNAGEWTVAEAADRPGRRCIASLTTEGTTFGIVWEDTQSVIFLGNRGWDLPEGRQTGEAVLSFPGSGRSDASRSVVSAGRDGPLFMSSSMNDLIFDRAQQTETLSVTVVRFGVSISLQLKGLRPALRELTECRKNARG